MKLIFLISLPFLILDQVTKVWILYKFPNYNEYNVIEVIPNFFNLVRVHNTGVAWGMFNGGEYSNLIFGAIATLVLVVVLIFFKKGVFFETFSKLGVAFLVSGILGNLIDRVLPGRGYVVDFLDFKIPFYEKLFPVSQGHFPSFNVADSCIFIASVMFIISTIREMKNSKKE